MPGNVGRELVRECYSYSISNVMDEGALCAQECVYGQAEADALGVEVYPAGGGHMEFHLSRNRFETVTGGNINILALAIQKNPNRKPMYG
jgi:hypothetical protein